MKIKKTSLPALFGYASSGPKSNRIVQYPISQKARPNAYACNRKLFEVELSSTSSPNLSLNADADEKRSLNMNKIKKTIEEP